MDIKSEMKIKTLKCTSHCCPSQWEGATDKGEMIYIRYRWGRLTIQLSEPGGTVRDAVNAKFLYQKQIGDEYAGVLSIDEIKSLIEKDGIKWDIDEIKVEW